MVRDSGGTELASDGLGLRSVSGSGEGLGLTRKSRVISLLMSFVCLIVPSLTLTFSLLAVPLLSVVTLPSIRS